MSDNYLINTIRLPSPNPDYHSLSILRIVDAGLIIVNLNQPDLDWVGQIVNFMTKEYVIPLIYIDIKNSIEDKVFDRKLLKDSLSNFMK